MERITVTAHFHAGHRQVGYGGKCDHVHGHTWRGRIVVEAEELPRDPIGMSLDFGKLKELFRRFDHKMLVGENDTAFRDSGLFPQDGVIVIPGKGPTVENVVHFVFAGVREHIAAKFPGLGVSYRIEVEIQETDNNFFLLEKRITV